MNFKELLKQAIEQNASDLHVTVGAPPIIRVDGRLMQLSDPPLKPEDTRNLVEQCLDEKNFALLQEKGEVDFSYSYPGMGRFRINVFYQRGTLGLAARIINTKPPTLHSLGLPDIVAKMARHTRGLLLVAGPSSSGKSTTLAAIIDLINAERSCHIITLEDPIEYLHSHKKSIINQREIGTDSKSFPAALQAALRQDPDVIMIGELKELESISIALTAAETGRLVLGALQTLTAPQTIQRLIEAFPPDQQEQIRLQLASTLIGIICQRLLPRRDGQGRVPAVEFLAVSPAVRTLIREGRLQQIYSYMQTGVRSGMRTMDSHLQQLYAKGLISPEEALENATDRLLMSRFLAQPFSRNSTEDFLSLKDISILK